MGILIAAALFLAGLCLLVLGASRLSGKRSAEVRGGKLMIVEPQFRRQAGTLAAQLGVALPAAGSPLEQYKGWFEEIGHRIQLNSIKKTQAVQTELTQQLLGLKKLWYEILQTDRKIAEEQAAAKHDAEVLIEQQSTRVADAKSARVQAEKKLKDLEAPPAPAPGPPKRPQPKDLIARAYEAAFAEAKLTASKTQIAAKLVKTAGVDYETALDIAENVIGRMRGS